MNQDLLKIEHLSVSFKNSKDQTHAVRDLSLTVKGGEVVGLVGESGSGKSVTARSIVGLLSNSKKTAVSGRVLFKGQNLLMNQERKRLNSQKIAMIFQDPLNSLNPVYTIGHQIREVFMVRKKMGKAIANARAIDILKKVDIQSPETIARQYPHQLSGGMCQRVMIAIALAAEPELLIADEPTTALDVTIQAQILKLLYQLYTTTKTAILFITHDLGLVAQFCHFVAIMQEGQIVEKGRVSDIFKNPQHPYTKGLINSIPVLGKKKRLNPMPLYQGGVHPNSSCSFFPRCTEIKRRCEKETPEFIEIEPGHFVRCHIEDGVSLL
ncbi:ABC transporter ATP-binding protein [bacterium]|nr:ABC transporter ATP-binding protein [bacterium]